MRTWVPASVGVRVQVTTDCRPSAAWSPEAFWLQERRRGWLDDENLAVSDAVPAGHGLGTEVEFVPDYRLKVVLHQPLLDERAFGERTPDFFRWIRHLAFDDDGASGGGNCLGHDSILSNRASRLVKPVTPEGAVEIEPVHHRRQRIGLCAIVSFASLAAMPYQLCPLQHG